MKKKKVEFFNPNAKVINKAAIKDNVVNSVKPEYSKEIDNNQIEKNILNSLKGEPSVFDVEILKPTLWQRLTSKTVKTFKVKKITLSQIAGITELLKDVPEVDLKNMSNEEYFANAMTLTTKENINRIIKVISIFLTGKEEKKTIEFLNNNLEAKDTLEFASNIIRLAGYQDFTLTTSLLKANLSMMAAKK